MVRNKIVVIMSGFIWLGGKGGIPMLSNLMQVSMVEKRFCAGDGGLSFFVG